MKFKQTEGFDVIVCGSGPAGFVAATAAARQKAKTLLIERDGTLGSVMSMGIIPHGFYSSKGAQVIGGIAQEFIDRLQEIGGAIGHVREGNRFYSVTPLDPYLARYLMNVILVENKVTVRTGMIALEPVYQKNHLSGLLAAGKDGIQIIPAKVIVDATGDADIATAAGARYQKGDQRGKMQPVSLCFRLNNINIPQFIKEVALEGNPAMGIKPGTTEPSPVYFSANFSRQPEFADLFYGDASKHFTCNSLWENDLQFNASFIPQIDATDPAELSRADIESRTQVVNIWHLMKKCIPSTRNSSLITAHRVSVRETRRIAGEYILRDQDVLAGAKFADGVARGCYPIDIHDPVTGKVYLTAIGGDGWYEIPLRSLIPQGVEGILVAGRCMAAESKAMASARAMSSCMSMGEAAGTAAAIAALQGLPIRKVDSSDLRDILKIS
jgi:hypothetical protein